MENENKTYMTKLTKRVLVELAWDLYVDEIDPYEKSDESMLFCFDKSAVVHRAADMAAGFGRLWKVEIMPETIKGLTANQAIDAITAVVDEAQIYSSLLDYLDDIVYEFACHEIATSFRHDPMLDPFREGYDEEYTDWAGVYLCERVEDIYSPTDYRDNCMAVKREHAALIARLQKLLDDYYRQNLAGRSFDRVVTYRVNDKS